jgi:TetR/AcrR family transcriptional regulator, tetracycline repressor protein
VHGVARRPGERAGLNADAVLGEGRRLLEEEGADALTMRRLAARLGVAPNSLYSHVPDKAALLDAVLDSLLAEIELPERDQRDWRDGLVALMAASRMMLLDHGDLLPQLLSRPMRGPNARRLGERTLGLLERGGITGPAAVDALRALLTLTFGSVVLDAPRRQDPDPTSRQSRTYAAFATPADTPRMARLADPLSRPPTEGAFETSLRWLIDGISRSARR